MNLCLAGRRSGWHSDLHVWDSKSGKNFWFWIEADGHRQWTASNSRYWLLCHCPHAFWRISTNYQVSNQVNVSAFQALSCLPSQMQETAVRSQEILNAVFVPILFLVEFRLPFSLAQYNVIICQLTWCIRHAYYQITLSISPHMVLVQRSW